MDAQMLLAKMEADLAAEQNRLTQVKEALAGTEVNVQRLTGAVLALRMVLAPEEGEGEPETG